MAITTIVAAITQGQGLRVAIAVLAAAGLPHAWQNFAPAVMDAPHAPQVAPASGAEQLLQNRPEAGAPHWGQVVCVMILACEREMVRRIITAASSGGVGAARHASLWWRPYPHWYYCSALCGHEKGASVPPASIHTSTRLRRV